MRKDKEWEMKVVRPAPSQAAVVLRKYLDSMGMNVRLSVAQEGVARMFGYADWNALAADMNTRDRAGALPTSRGSHAEDESNGYPMELAHLPALDWMRAYEACFPQALFRRDPNETYNSRVTEQDLNEAHQAESRLKSDLYLAVSARELPSEYRYVPGAIDVVIAHHHQLSLVFERRVENRLAIRFCPTLNWDTLEVNIGRYEFNDVLGEEIVDEVWHSPIVAADDESLASVIDRGMCAAQELARDLKGWIVGTRFMTAAQHAEKSNRG
ncbi:MULTISPECIES: glyoxalase superfamily protein [Paraburkholderia]|uniref:glyoxalase superfamily protein n=1 Tax=Paraburkholderia TaxID=1822464 RepID=UPI0016562E0F|nr:glyoxalase superfamily protein [Paraburkholderia podalyriae]